MSVFQGKRAAAAAAITAATALALAPQALAASFEVNFDCAGDSPLGQQEFSLQQSTEVTAPETVAPGGDLEIVIDPAPNTVPAEVNGFQVEQVEGFELKIPIPENSETGSAPVETVGAAGDPGVSTFVSAELSGGFNLGPNPPTLTVDGGIATLHLDGPLAGGAEFELPTVTAHLKAGESGTIETKLYGTSYDDPGLTFNAVVSTIIGDVEVPSSCYPNPNPVLTTTTIS